MYIYFKVEWNYNKKMKNIGSWKNILLLLLLLLFNIIIIIIITIIIIIIIIINIINLTLLAVSCQYGSRPQGL